MFTKTPTITGLDQAIDNLLLDMRHQDSTSDDYSVMLAQLSKLYKLKEHDAPKRISPDTIAIIAGNLAGIILIINYEKANVVTSKALSFVLKLR